MNVIIIIPAYNEEENIAQVIKEINTVVPQYKYVIVNDGLHGKTDMMRPFRLMRMVSMIRNIFRIWYGLWRRKARIL